VECQSGKSTWLSTNRVIPSTTPFYWGDFFNVNQLGLEFGRNSTKSNGN